MDRQNVKYWIVLACMVLLVMVMITMFQGVSTPQIGGADDVFAADVRQEPVPTIQPAVDAEMRTDDASVSKLSAATVLTRTLAINPASLIRDLDSTNITMNTDIALRWEAGNTDEAGFYLRQPPDWNTTTPIKVHLYFALGGDEAGAINWRLKLNTYTPNSGEWLTNPGTRDADAILNFPEGGSWYRIYSQTFTLPPEAFNDEPLWSFFFLRGSGSNGETFAGSLFLLDVELEYQAISPISALYIPLIEQ